MKQMLIGTVAGGVTFFLLGGLIYAVILADFYEANLGSATGVLRDLPILWAMVVSQLGMAAVVTYVFLHADVATAPGVLKTGAIFGLFRIGPLPSRSRLFRTGDAARVAVGSRPRICVMTADARDAGPAQRGDRPCGERHVGRAASRSRRPRNPSLRTTRRSR
jgi:hypothetical protein